MVVGYYEGLSCHSLTYAVLCLLENEGCRLVATNRDFQYQANGGRRMPGAGAHVAAIVAGANREPDMVRWPRRHDVI